MNAKTTELFENKEFLTSVLALTPEEAQKKFAAEGSDITVEELRELGDAINRKIQDDELKETDLEDVAGLAPGRRGGTVFRINHVHADHRAARRAEGGERIHRGENVV